MANPTNVIVDAFEKLKRSISEEDAHNFACTDLQDVWKAVREIENVQRKRQSAQNMRRIEPLLRGIEKYSKVIEVLCNGTPYLPFIWVCYSLNIVFRDRSRFVGSDKAHVTGKYTSQGIYLHDTQSFWLISAFSWQVAIEIYSMLS